MTNEEQIAKLEHELKSQALLAVVLLLPEVRAIETDAIHFAARDFFGSALIRGLESRGVIAHGVPILFADTNVIGCVITVSDLAAALPSIQDDLKAWRLLEMSIIARFDHDEHYWRNLYAGSYQADLNPALTFERIPELLIEGEAVAARIMNETRANHQDMDARMRLKLSRWPFVPKQ